MGLSATGAIFFFAGIYSFMLLPSSSAAGKVAFCCLLHGVELGRELKSLSLSPSHWTLIAMVTYGCLLLDGPPHVLFI